VQWDMCVGYDLTKIDMDGVADDMASVTISVSSLRLYTQVPKSFKGNAPRFVARQSET